MVTMEPVGVTNRAENKKNVVITIFFLRIFFPVGGDNKFLHDIGVGVEFVTTFELSGVLLLWVGGCEI